MSCSIRGENAAQDWDVNAENVLLSAWNTGLETVSYHGSSFMGNLVMATPPQTLTSYLDLVYFLNDYFPHLLYTSRHFLETLNTWAF